MIGQSGSQPKAHSDGSNLIEVQLRVACIMSKPRYSAKACLLFPSRTMLFG